MIDLVEAIVAIKSDAVVTVHDNDITKIIWLDGNPTNITNDQIIAKQAELQTAYNAEQWKRNRQTEYPSIVDCIHALLDGGDTLTDLQAKRTAIKNKYLKE